VPVIFSVITFMALLTGSGNAAAQTPLSCQIGTANYDPVLCAQQGGNSVFSPGLPATVQVTSSGCGSTIPINVLVRNAAGAAVTDGTSVVITTNLGTVTPNQAVTGGGAVNAVLSVVAPIGTATVTATAGAISGSTTVGTQCAAPFVPPLLNQPFIPFAPFPPAIVVGQPAAPANITAPPATTATGAPPAVAGASAVIPPTMAPPAVAGASAIIPPATGDGGVFYTQVS
jgi:hypothetical protein